MRIARLFAFAAILAALAAAPAFAMEARPWLCRDKPVFSDPHGMKYQAAVEGSRSWRLFFMEFSPEAAHDGFDIVNSTATLRRSAPAAGHLDAGRYFAVAMYSRGGRWTCPGYARENRNFTPGVVRKICYAEDSPPCHVTLTVKPASPVAH